MSQPPRVVHVDIQGQRYAIRTSLDSKYVTDIAAYVDARLELASRSLSTTDASRIAVVAALNIADDLFRARAESSDGRLQARAAEIERILDAVLESAPATPPARARER
jgi:cell division protein ZapA